MIDVDYFKPYNDHYGHLAGDDFLREISRRLQACVRTPDLVARLAGDEFVILLGDVGLDEPTATVSIKLGADNGSYELLVGDNAEGKNRWVKTPSDSQIYSISSWAGDWATANVDKFQEQDEATKDTSTQD